MTAPVLGLAAAAKACNVSESTLRRKRPELLELGAAQTSKGWQIPVTALIELGLMARTTPASSGTPDRPAMAGLEGFTEAPTQTLMTAPLEPLRAELEALRTALAEAEKRAAVAEAVASEKERIIRVQEQALRMLEGPRQSEPVQQPAPPAQEQPAPAPEPKRRKWWKL